MFRFCWRRRRLMFMNDYDLFLYFNWIKHIINITWRVLWTKFWFFFFNVIFKNRSYLCRFFTDLWFIFFIFLIIWRYLSFWLLLDWFFSNYLLFLFLLLFLLLLLVFLYLLDLWRICFYILYFYILFICRLFLKISCCVFPISIHLTLNIRLFIIKYILTVLNFFTIFRQ
jgi:hypothetical protein